MNKHLFIKILHFLLLIFLIYTSTFFLVRIIPGDPIDTLIAQTNFTANDDFIRLHFGLNLSLYEQFQKALINLIHLDFGISIHQNIKVIELITPALFNTYLLASLSIAIALFFGVSIGLYASMNRGSLFEKLTNIINPILIAIPSFVLAPLLILIFAIWLHLLPISGMEGYQSIILPALTLSIGLTAYLSQMTMDCANELLDSPVISSAKARGLSTRKIFFTHIFRLIILPVLTAIGLQLGALLSGAIITEMIFSWNGIGKLMIDSIHQRDYAITQAAIFFIATSYVSINFLLDFLYNYLDPRTVNNE